MEDIRQSTPGRPKRSSLTERDYSLSDVKDTTLLRLLQEDSSQFIDENGEPKLKYYPHEYLFESDKSIPKHYSISDVLKNTYFGSLIFVIKELVLSFLAED